MSRLQRGVWLLLALSLAFAARASELRLYTEDYPPLNFIEDGQLRGMAVEVVEALGRRTGDRVQIEMGPWTRGYQAAQDQADRGLFTVVRTDEREPLFQWVGPIMLAQTSFYSLKGSGVRAANLEEAAALGVLALPRKWYSYEVLAAQGFKDLYAVPGPKQMVTMFKHGRVKLIVANDSTLREMLALGDLRPDQVEQQYSFMRSESYIAFSRQTDVRVVQRWQRALDDMQRDGSFARIYRHWLPDAELPGAASLGAD